MSKLADLTKKRRLLYRQRKSAFDAVEEAEQALMYYESYYDKVSKELDEIKSKIKELKKTDNSYHANQDKADQTTIKQ